MTTALKYWLLPLLQLLSMDGLSGFVSWLVLPWAVLLNYRFTHIDKPRDFNPLLAETALFQFALGLLLSLSFVSTGMMAVAH